mmetsp:Transcript_22750/g.36535  ORF Transcript_22750/g.36535 Transcript_22750/m.36535 type:complete len:204 (-) Transcript_22750:280-891(-)
MIHLLPNQASQTHIARINPVQNRFQIFAFAHIFRGEQLRQWHDKRLAEVFFTRAIVDIDVTHEHQRNLVHVAQVRIVWILVLFRVVLLTIVGCRQQLTIRDGQRTKQIALDHLHQRLEHRLVRPHLFRHVQVVENIAQQLLLLLNRLPFILVRAIKIESRTTTIEPVRECMMTFIEPFNLRQGTQLDGDKCVLCLGQRGLYCL